MSTTPLLVTSLRLTPPAPWDCDRAVIGYLQFRVGWMEMDAGTLRRRRDGGLAISYPARCGSHGGPHPIARFSEAERRLVERQILAVLGAEVRP